MKNTIRLARIGRGVLPRLEPVDDHGGPGDLHRAGAEAREQPDAERDRQRRLAAIAPAGHQHGQQAEHQERDAPAQHDRIEQSSARCRTARAIAVAIEIGSTSRQLQRADFATVNGVLADEIDQQQRTAAIRGS